MNTVLPNRGVLAISGDDRIAFLQGLVTNDIGKVSEANALYACLLNAQGRFLHDFFIVADGERLLLDCEADRREDLMKRLKLFRLRSKVEIVDETAMFAVSALSAELRQAEVSDALDSGEIIYADPRFPALGRRMLSLVQGVRASSSQFDDNPALAAYDRLRISLGVPDGSRDMVPGEALLLENNIDMLNGIAWDKGCYVGQELTARMKYKAQVRKRLTPVRLDGPPVAPGTLLVQGEREIGEMRSSCGDLGLALLRVDAQLNEVQSNGTKIILL